MNRLIACAASVGLLVLAACGGGGSEPKPPTHVISGTITRAWGGALGGVAVHLGGAATGTAMTDASGKYTFPSASDGTYTLRPELSGWVFAPGTPTVVVSGADATRDFTADGAYSISGTVSGAVQVQGGVSIALSGGGVVKPAAVSAAGTGAYAFTGVPDGTYTLTPTLDGYAFTPAAPTVVVSGAGATQDFTSAAILRIAGTLRDGAGAPLSGMTVRLTGARSAIATTDAAGAYAFTDLAPGQAYTVTPATFGWTFDPGAGAPGPAERSYTLTGSVTDADFGGDAAGPAVRALHGTLSYAGSRTGPVYVTIGGQYGMDSPVGGTGLASQGGPWSGRAFAVRNVQAMGWITVRAWIDTLGIGRFVAGADPSVTFAFDTAGGATDLGDHALTDPAAPSVASGIALGQAAAGDGAAVVIFDPPRDSSHDLVADGYRVYWNDGATVDADHTLGTITVPAGSNFAVVHGLANGTAYWFAVEAWLDGATLAGQRATSTAPVTPGPPGGGATISGTIGHPAVAAPCALYVVAQSGQKGPGAGIWWQRIPNPSGTQTAYTLRAPPGTYAIFAFVDLGDDGAVGVGEPARFQDWTTSFFTAVAGPNAGPTVAIPGGAASPWLTTLRWGSAFASGTALELAVASGAKVPLSAVITGPGLRGPLDLGLKSGSGGVGATLGASFDPAPVFPFTGDAYDMEVTYADGSTETFRRPVTGSFGAPPGVIAPVDGAAGVATVPTFQWSAPPGAGGSYGWVLELGPQSADEGVWATFLPGTQTSVLYDADGQALTSELAPYTDYRWNVIAIDADGNRAVSQASFATGAPTLPLYDALGGTALDGQLWGAPQFSRSITGGKAVLAVQADHVQARTVRGLVYGNAINVLPGSQRVTALRATVSVPAATAGRTGTAVIAAGVRLAYQPAANRGQLFPDASLNTLFAALELYDDGSGLQVRRRFYHCADAACIAGGGAGITVSDPAGFTLDGVDARAPATAGMDYTLELSLVETSGVFTWSVEGGEFTTPASGTADASDWARGVGLAFDSTTNGFLHAALFARVHDDAGGSSGTVAAEFDGVAVGFDGAAASPWDDFSAGYFRPGRWGAVDSDVWLGGDGLHLASQATTAVTGSFLGESTTVGAMYPASFGAWQADVAIVADDVAPFPSSSNSVGMVGAYYNDGTPGGGAAGDVRARITLQSGAAGWSIFRCSTATCTSTTGVASGSLSPSPGHPLGVGTVHRLLVVWDPVSRVFTFGLDDAPVVQVDPTATAPVVDPTPHYPTQVLTTNVGIGSTATAGTTARIEAAFANVRALPR